MSLGHNLKHLPLSSGGGSVDPDVLLSNVKAIINKITTPKFLLDGLGKKDPWGGGV